MSRNELVDRYLAAVPHTGTEVLSHPCPVPAEPGVYGWWFRRLPADIDVSRCEHKDGLTLLHAGISPGPPPRNGKPSSRQHLRNRVTYHFRGDAEGSTLRKTLGCLLAGELGIELRRVGSGTRRTFATGEATLSRWMVDHTLVSWVTTPEPWLLKQELFHALDLPLNLRDNPHNAFHQTLTAVRAEAEARARRLPILSNQPRPRTS